MADFLNEFNNSGVKKFSDLVKNKNYLIVDADIVNGRFGDCVLLKLFDLENDRELKIFLGKKYTQAFSEEVIGKIKSKEIKYMIKYVGSYKTSFGEEAPKYFVSIGQ